MGRLLTSNLSDVAGDLLILKKSQPYNKSMAGRKPCVGYCGVHRRREHGKGSEAPNLKNEDEDEKSQPGDPLAD
jgi:hypothetical protein